MKRVRARVRPMEPTRRHRPARGQGGPVAAVAAALVALGVSGCSTGPESADLRRAAAEAATDGSVVVAEGSSLGVDWSLRGARTGDVICLELDDGSGGKGTDCGPPVDPGGIRFGSQQAAEHTPVFVVGQAGKAVASVEVVMSEGRSVEAEPVEVDGLPVNVYVAVLPPRSRPAEVVARNSVRQVTSRSS